jgi:hypothetical protein
MKELRMRAIFGMLGLAGAGFLVSSVTTAVGCSDGGSLTGTAGTGGSSAGTAGTTGAAGTTGSGGNSGGSGGGGGATTALGCAVSDLPPAPAPLIADFGAVDGGAPVIPIGGTFSYASPSGAPSPVATVTNGGWNVKLTAPGMVGAAQYIGVGIYFNGPGDPNGGNCVDGTAYTGIKFDISGSVGGTMCSAQYSTNDSAHSNNASDKKGSGDATSYAPQAPLTVTSTVTTVMMPFTGTGAPTGGNPALALAKDKLTGVQWQFTVAAATAAAATDCAVDITIDNVSFY